MISLDNLKTVINAIKCLLTDYPKKRDIPTKLPNPNPLTFTGAVTRSYDGSEALAVEIPSVTKPLTYDYMPEGYPTKTMGTVALLEEQELAFKASPAGAYTSAISRHSPEIVVGQTYTVKWDGAEYECVGFKFDVNTSAIGNPSILGKGDDTGEPFLYTYNIRRGRGVFGTHDTSASHTISVKTTAEVITPMVEEFLPTGVTAAAIDNAQSTADTAQATADTAQATAARAQATADTAKTTADAAATKANPVFTGTFSQNRNANTVIGDYSHAEGYNTTASGESSHAEGIFTTAARDYSHAEGCRTKACSSYQHTQGKYNIEDSSNTYAHIVGNGDSDTSRSNAHTLDWSGNAWFAGTIEGAALIIPSSTEGSTKKFKITVDDSGTLTATDVTV